MSRTASQSQTRLFTVPYFSVRSYMSIVESDGPPSWSLDASETGESTKCPWVGYFVLSPVLLASRDLNGSGLNSTIDIYDLTEK